MQTGCPRAGRFPFIAAARCSARPTEVERFKLHDGETLQLRFFIDRSVIAVFENRRKCLALRVDPSRNDSVGMTVQAQGKDATLSPLNAWRMNSVYQI